MKKNYKKYLSFFAIAVTGIFSIYSATGPGTTFGVNVTGAPFDGGTCTGCHTPGTNWNATMGIQLLSGSTPVTTYVPNATYTLRITRAAVGLPGPGGFGFQMTCATSVGNSNINNWGSLPPGVQAINLSSRDYVEHSSKFPNSTSQVDIPWTAPSSIATGTVVFYIALNTVNGNGNNSNDQVLNTSLSISPSPTPVTWLYFKGKEIEGNVLLEWATANESNNSHYTLQKSRNGQDFETIATVQAIKNSNSVQRYSYTDNIIYSNTYYRIKQTDLSGESSYFNTIEIASSIKPGKAYHYTSDKSVIVQLPYNGDETATAVLYDIAGKVVSTTDVPLFFGNNTIYIEKPSQQGIYMINLSSKGKAIYSGKVFVN